MPEEIATLLEFVAPSLMADLLKWGTGIFQTDPSPGKRSDAERLSVSFGYRRVSLALARFTSI